MTYWLVLRTYWKFLNPVKTEATSAAPAAPSTVAGKETTFIEIGAGGAPVRSGSDKPLEEVEQILVVVDPRALPNMVAAKELLAANVPSPRNSA